MSLLIKFNILIFIFFLLGCQANPDDLIFAQNYQEGIRLASKLDKPIFLQFTGFGCLGYNEFENDLITSKEVQEILNNDFITVLLYVDDKRPIEAKDTLNLNRLIFSKEGKQRLKKAKNKGNINATIQIEKYNQNAQPLYVIIDKDGNNLIDAFGYTSRNKDYFLSKLKKGLMEFNKRNEN